MNKNTKWYVIVAAVFSLILFSACESDDPAWPDGPADGQYTGNAYRLKVWADPDIVPCNGSAFSLVSAQLFNQLSHGEPNRTVYFQLFYNGFERNFDPDGAVPVDYNRESGRQRYGYLTNETDVTDGGGMARTWYYGPTDPWHSLFVEGPDSHGTVANVPTGATRYMIVQGTVSVNIEIRQITLVDWYPVCVYWPY